MNQFLLDWCIGLVVFGTDYFGTILRIKLKTCTRYYICMQRTVILIYNNHGQLTCVVLLSSKLKFEVVAEFCCI